MGLIKKLGYVGRAGLAAGAIYAISLLPSGCSTKVNEKPIQKPKIELNLPDKLTQQTPDFYVTPENEFEFYKKKFVDFAKDGIINSNEVETLELVLSKTLEEIRDKVIDKETGELKESLPKDEKILKYMAFIRKIGERDLQELRKHLDLKKEWLESKAVKGKFWHYGLGTCFYTSYVDNGNVGRHFITLSNGERAIGLPRLFKEKELYKHINPRSIVKGDYNYPKVPELWEEFPAKTKFNYWPGLLAGLFLPTVLGIAGCIGKEITGKKVTDDELGVRIAVPFMVHSVGTLIFDSIHPLVYPVRLGMHLFYEAGWWLLSREKKTKTSPPRGRPKPKPMPKPSLEETVEEKKEEPKFINPWEIEIPEIK